MFHQEPWAPSDACLVTSLSLSNSMLSETPGGRVSLVCIAIPVSPALTSTRSAHSQNCIFSGLMGQIQGTHPSPRWTCKPPVYKLVCFRVADYTLPGRASVSLSTTNQSQVRTDVRCSFSIIDWAKIKLTAILGHPLG
jgi:hypothetical protein